MLWHAVEALACLPSSSSWVVVPFETAGPAATGWANSRKRSCTSKGQIGAIVEVVGDGCTHQHSPLPLAVIRPSKDRVQSHVHQTREGVFDDGDDGTTINYDEGDDDVAADAIFVHDELEEESVVDPYLLPEGIREGYFVVRHHVVPPDGLGDPKSHGLFRQGDISRLGLRSTNMTLPSALMVLDRDAYPTLSHALRACRRGRIVIHRGPLPLARSEAIPCTKEEDGERVRNESRGARPPLIQLDFRGCSRGNVWDRVHPNDVVAVQAPASVGGAYNDDEFSDLTRPPPPFDLPVVYEDDHIAIVNKPEGVSVHPHSNEQGVQHKVAAEDSSDDCGGFGGTATSILAALPFVLTAPREGTDGGVLWRPHPVHRLDKPTSGLLVVAKTRLAAADLSRQFAEGVVQKTYTAVCHGVPSEDEKTSLSTSAARRILGGVVAPWNNRGNEEGEGCGDSDSTPRPWQIIDRSLDGKTAVTVWRSLGRLTFSDFGVLRRSGDTDDEELSVVELRPKTGRYHQLRRHMARTKDCPLLGDEVYGSRGAGRWTDGQPFLDKPRQKKKKPQQKRQQPRHGLFLCCNELSIQHPFYNSDVGRRQWDEVNADRGSENGGSGMAFLAEDESSTRVVINARIGLPDKFYTLLEPGRSR